MKTFSFLFASAIGNSSSSFCCRVQCNPLKSKSVRVLLENYQKTKEVNCLRQCQSTQFFNSPNDVCQHVDTVKPINNTKSLLKNTNISPCNKERIHSRKMSTKADGLFPRPLVLAGPSGSGKSSLLKRLFKEFPKTFAFSVSHTTREPRAGEENGVHYYFVTKDHMLKAIANGEFIETTTFCGNIYGTSKEAIRAIQKTGKVCVLDIELNGVEQIKQTDLNPILIFNNPPTIEELERRLRKRGSETEESLKKRLDASKEEITYGLKEGNFHKIIHNVDLDKSYKEFRDFIVYELREQEGQGVKICW